MKRATWIILSALALSTPALASNWSNVSPGEPETVFVDRDSIRHEGDLTTATVLHNYSSVKTVGDTAFPHKSKIIVYSIRCEDSRLGFAEWSMRSGELGTGQTVWARHAQSVAYFDATNDPVYGKLLSEICG
jgi:hypothetical protein